MFLAGCRLLHEGSFLTGPLRSPDPGVRTILRARPKVSNPSKMNTYAKRVANPREMNTSKSLDLKSRVMNTYKKRGGGGTYCYPAPTPGGKAMASEHAWHRPGRTLAL